MAIPTIRSRLLNRELVEDREGRTLFEIRRPMQRPRGAGVRIVVLTQHASLHQLAYQQYGDPMWWWAIADVNNIFDPTTELFSGQRILVPSREEVERYLNGEGTA